MTKTQIPYLPPEIIEHILKRSDSSTLQNCLEIKYLKDMTLHHYLDKTIHNAINIIVFFWF